MKANSIKWTIEMPFNIDIKKEYIRYIQIKNKMNDGYQDYLFDNFLREFFTPMFKDFSKRTSSKFKGKFIMKRTDDYVTGRFESTSPIGKENLDEFKNEFNETLKELLNSDKFIIKY